MKSITKAFVFSLAGVLAAGLVSAQSEDFSGAIKARQAHMTLYGANLGVLGAMAQGNVPYVAEVASVAADNLLALSAMDQRLYWRDGSAAGAVEGTRAMQAIWDDPEGFAAAQAEMLTAATAMAAVAGDGLEGVQGAMRAVGGACGACHQNYRVSE